MFNLPPILESGAFSSKPPLSASEISMWEKSERAQVPQWLSSLLQILNGGMIKGVDYHIAPLDQFHWVDDDLDDDPNHEMRLLCIGGGPHGSRLVLDYTASGEPMVRLLYMDTGGEFDSVDASFLRIVGIENAG